MTVLADTLRRHRNERATRSRKLSAGRQALLVVAYLRKGETYSDLACGFKVGTSTVVRVSHELARHDLRPCGGQKVGARYATC